MVTIENLNFFPLSLEGIYTKSGVGQVCEPDGENMLEKCVIFFDMLCSSESDNVCCIIKQMYCCPYTKGLFLLLPFSLRYVLEFRKKIVCNSGNTLPLWRLKTYVYIYIYISRTAQLTSRRCILNIYSTNILTEYFKHAAHSPYFFSLQDAVYFIMLPFFGSCYIHI
jgi:hypothetical protein